jgi:hypothetical protein
MRSVPDDTDQGTAGAAGKQSPAMSFIEAVMNVVVGFLLALLALLTQIAIFPLISDTPDQQHLHGGVPATKFRTTAPVRSVPR